MKINYGHFEKQRLFYLTTSHAMEEKLWGLDASHEPSIDESTCSWTGVEWSERGKGFPRNHQRRSFTLQLDLTQQT